MELTDGTLVLRPPESSDTDAIFAAVTESLPELTRWLPWAHDGYTRAESGSWIAHCGDQWNGEREHLEFFVFDRDGRFLGGSSISQKAQGGEIGYWIRTSAAGRGVATAVVRLLARYGFETLGLDEIVIRADPDNIASQRVADKACGVRMGVQMHTHGDGSEHPMVEFVLRRETPSPLAYARDISDWEDWQREYRFGAFYIFPPAGIIEDIDELRKAHDPASHVVCQAHVSLSEPLSQPLSEDLLAEIQNALKRIEPFVIRYGKVRATPPYPGVVYSIEPESEFKRLRATLHSTSIFGKSSLQGDHIPSHMTIAEFISMDRSSELAAELAGKVREGEWVCDQIEYAVPNEQFSFVRVRALPLG